MADIKPDTDHREGLKAELSAASNPKTSPDQLKDLSTSKDELVRGKLSEDKEPFVREGVANNSKTPSETLGKLSGGSEITVRAGVAQNENASTDTLTKPGGDSENRVREAAAENKANAPGKESQAASTDKSIPANAPEKQASEQTAGNTGNAPTPGRQMEMSGPASEKGLEKALRDSGGSAGQAKGADKEQSATATSERPKDMPEKSVVGKDYKNPEPDAKGADKSPAQGKGASLDAVKSKRGAAQKKGSGKSLNEIKAKNKEQSKSPGTEKAKSNGMSR